MCGIAGFISAKPLDRHTARDLSSAMLWYAAERGQQSSGIFINGRTLKRAMPPSSFIETSAFHNLFDKPATMALLHTRQPTSGGHGDDQAQPFQRGGTVVVHNGMFWDCAQMKQDWGIKKPSGVDSELACAFVAKYGPERLPEMLTKAFSVSALAVVHNSSLYLVRDGNPTSYCFMNLGNGNRIFAFASTEDILKQSLSYVWLIPESVQFWSTADAQLYHATPATLTKIGPPFPTSGHHMLSLAEHEFFERPPKQRGGFFSDKGTRKGGKVTFRQKNSS